MSAEIPLENASVFCTIEYGAPGFELADGLHRIEKRFLHRDPYARLTLPDGTRIEGDEAEERLQALVGFTAGGKRGASDESRGVWGALWVDQQMAPQHPGAAPSAYPPMQQSPPPFAPRTASR